MTLNRSKWVNAETYLLINMFCPEKNAVLVTVSLMRVKVKVLKVSINFYADSHQWFEMPYQENNGHHCPRVVIEFTPLIRCHKYRQLLSKICIHCVLWVIDIFVYQYILEMFSSNPGRGCTKTTGINVFKNSTQNSCFFLSLKLR